MEQGRIERNRIRLINSERFILELYLLVYPLFFVTGASVAGDHYLWLVIVTVAGCIAYVIFAKNEFSIIVGIVFSALLAVPFVILSYPLLIIVLLFVFVFWRLQANFSESKSNGWPFLVVNTILFTSFYLITMPFYVYHNPYELAKVHITLYLLTTVLYFVIHFTVIGIMGRHLGNFNIVDVGKMFVGVLGAGVVTFLSVLYLLEPLRNGIVAVLGFLFGGLFMLVSKGIVAPIWDRIVAWLDANRAEYYETLVEESEYVDFEMLDERKVFGATSTLPDIISVTLIVITALIVFIVLVRKRRKMLDANGGDGFLFRSDGRKKKSGVRSVYDYSVAVDTVRNAFKDFEQAAQSSNAPRLRGETVKEWFLRMGWVQNEAIFNTYDKVRYGSFGVTEDESNHFSDELEELKNNYFSKEV